GGQQLSLWNAHYDSRCFLPIHIYEATSGKPVAVILRPGKTPDGAEVALVLRHVIGRIRARWPAVEIMGASSVRRSTNRIMGNVTPFPKTSQARTIGVGVLTRGKQRRGVDATKSASRRTLDRGSDVEIAQLVARDL